MPGWDEKVTSLNVRFGSDMCYDPIVELRNVK